MYPNMNQLKDDIDRYFEAQLSQEEERDLLRTLLKMEGQDPMADEALAVMLASRVGSKAIKRRRKIPPIIRIAGIAASIALILGIGAFHMRQSQESKTFAYVSGKKIIDRNQINNIVATQLQDMGESNEILSQTLSSDFNDIREALITDDI